MRIGLIGVAGAGKDTAAKMLSDLTGIPVVSFAKPLHEAAIHIWGNTALNREDKEKEQIFGELSFEWFNDYPVFRQGRKSKRALDLTEYLSDEDKLALIERLKG